MPRRIEALLEFASGADLFQTTLQFRLGELPFASAAVAPRNADSNAAEIQRVASMLPLPRTEQRALFDQIG